jgi:kumamolisin
MNAILAAAAARGVNVFVASGDSGSSDGMGPPDSTHADFPASSPHVIACGGTTLVSDGVAIASETVWNASGGAAGGAFSKVFSKLPHQAQVPGGKRGVPDVCGCADPATGYTIVVAGRRMVVGGTSAVAPLYAGLAARLQAAVRGRLPPLGPVLYANKEAAVVDIITGSNGAYMAAKGWDAASGLGRIVGSGLQTALGV